MQTQVHTDLKTALVATQGLSQRRFQANIRKTAMHARVVSNMQTQVHTDLKTALVATQGWSQWRFQATTFILKNRDLEWGIPQIELNRDSAPSHNTSCAPKDDTIIVNRLKS